MKQHDYNLFINYYTDSSEERQRELDYCVGKNINAGFKAIVVICNEDDLRMFRGKFTHKNIIPVVTSKRPTFNDFFDLTGAFSDKNNINIIANLDIFFHRVALLSSSRFFNSATKKCLALTRWDFYQIGNPKFFGREDSQDVWIFNGSVNKVNADFKLGIAGCDNKVALLLSEAGYSVLNPSKSIRTYHYHLSGVRNYFNPEKQEARFIKPPYLFLKPTD